MSSSNDVAAASQLDASNDVEHASNDACDMTKNNDAWADRAMTATAHTISGFSKIKRDAAKLATPAMFILARYMANSMRGGARDGIARGTCIINIWLHGTLLYMNILRCDASMFALTDLDKRSGFTCKL